ncbi:flagellar basal body rod protein FlgB [Phenylobacterium sp. LjRoot225]|uniref:flagellar basal body rod protein FlgB n=1 Tax=Phenylobacterium sp. LjRoot225 TaxID=3342285 RepID=UPI003ECE52EE
MDLSQIPLFAMLRGRLGYLSERQQLIAQNVANSDTANFRPKDLKPFSFHVQERSGASSAAAVTQPGHIPLQHGSAGGSAAFQQITAPDSETRLNGNGVVLEEQMMKMSESRMNYDAAISFYQKSLGILRMATRAPGR